MTNIIEWLKQDAQQYPNKIAVIDPEQTMTYAQLWDMVQVCTAYFQKQISPKQPVVFLQEKKCTTLAMMLGVINAGGFYSLLDIRQPTSRMKQVLHVLDAHVLVYDQANAHLIQDFMDITELTICQEQEVLKDHSEQYENRPMDVHNPLYVNFTSGSTGTPKGVCIRQESVVEFIEDFVQTQGLVHQDIFANQAPFDFDVSVKDIYSSLFVGGTLVIIPRDYFTQPMKLMDYLQEHQVTILTWAVSALCFVSMMNGFGYKLVSSIRRVMFSGEVMPIKQLNVWMKANPQAIFVNLYGPTEITCNCTYAVLENREYANDEVLPIGISFPHKECFLLDEHEQVIQEDHKTGELCVAGRCLASGYYHDEQKTNLAFKMFNGKRIYHTGDLAYRVNGLYYFVGRKDFQIKHLGHRIELGEIESTLLSTSGVQQACCLYDDRRKKLVCFVAGQVDKEDVFTMAKQHLPVYMIPNKLLVLEQMPLNKNGKIDRQKLKEMGNIQ